jgi:hypothetical protein
LEDGFNTQQSNNCEFSYKILCIDSSKNKIKLFIDVCHRKQKPFCSCLCLRVRVLENVQLPEWFALMALGFFPLISSVTPANLYAISLSRSLIHPFYFLIIFSLVNFRYMKECSIGHWILDSGLFPELLEEEEVTSYSPFSFSKQILILSS